jgi:hypothetical protein
MAWLLIALLVLAGIGKAVADAQAHGSPRLLRWFPKWAANDAWRNKYKDRDPSQGPAFPLADTLLVAFTDLWHFANLVTWAAADAAFLVSAWPTYRWWAVGAVLARRCVFQPLYSLLRK